jgi:hypothetical protein
VSTKALREENTRLREQLNLKSAPTSLESWERFGSQRSRDEMAAIAYMREWGDPRRALMLLGFTEEASYSEELQRRIIGTAGVAEIVEESMRPARQQRAEIIARITKIARFGSDDAAIRAAVQLAKIEGWVKGDTGNSTNVHINLHSLVHAKETVEPQGHEKQVLPLEAPQNKNDILTLLAHDPGEPVRVSLGDLQVTQTAHAGDEEDE